MPRRRRKDQKGPKRPRRGGLLATLRRVEDAGGAPRRTTSSHRLVLEFGEFEAASDPEGTCTLPDSDRHGLALDGLSPRNLRVAVLA